MTPGLDSDADFTGKDTRLGNFLRTFQRLHRLRVHVVHVCDFFLKFRKVIECMGYVRADRLVKYKLV